MTICRQISSFPTAVPQKRLDLQSNIGCPELSSNLSYLSREIFSENSSPCLDFTISEASYRNISFGELEISFFRGARRGRGRAFPPRLFLSPQSAFLPTPPPNPRKKRNTKCISAGRPISAAMPHHSTHRRKKQEREVSRHIRTKIVRKEKKWRHIYARDIISKMDLCNTTHSESTQIGLFSKDRLLSALQEFFLNWEKSARPREQHEPQKTTAPVFQDLASRKRMPLERLLRALALDIALGVQEDQRKWKLPFSDWWGKN